MQVRIQLMGGLKANAPPENVLELEEGASISGALDRLEIAGSQVQVVMHNGRPQANRETVLTDGDELTVIPLAGGG